MSQLAETLNSINPINSMNFINWRRKMQRLTDSELIDELKKRFDESEKVLTSLKVVNSKLVDVNRKLQESEALKSNFLSNIKNEINNPLTSVLFMAKELKCNGMLNREAVVSMADIIYNEVFNLDYQLRNIFAAAELEAGEAAPGIARVDIDSLILNSIESFLHKADAKNISMSFDSLCESENDPHFNANPEKLQLVINNILSNAVEFSLEGGMVEISACKNQGNLNISVKDHGSGIDESNHTLIFDRFRQIDTGVSKGHLGHGLGLSIAKALMELMNGTITVESSKNKGATFKITIPEAESETEVDAFSNDGNEFIFENAEEF